MDEWMLKENSSKRKISLRTILQVFLIFSLVMISIGGVSTFPNHLRMPLILVTAAVTFLVICFDRKKIFLTMPISLLILTVIYLFCSVLYSLDKAITLELAVVYLCATLLLLADYSETFFEKMIAVMKVFCIIIAISIILSSFIDNFMLSYFGFIINPTNNPDVVTFLTQEINWAGSYSGFAREKGEAAFIMNVGISICLAKYFTEKNFSIRDVFFLLIMFWALILTSKRMLFLTAITTLCFLLFLSKKEGRLVKIIPIILGAMCGFWGIAVLVPQFLNLFKRFLDKETILNLTGRVELWPYCLEMFCERPLFGLGIGSYNQYLYNNDIKISGETWKHYGHNIYCEFLGELGIVGCTLLFGALFLLFYRTIVLMRSEKTNSKQKYLLTFSCSLQIICLIYSITGNVLLRPQQIFSWFICLAITTTVSNKETRNQKSRFR